MNLHGTSVYVNAQGMNMAELIRLRKKKCSSVCKCKSLAVILTKMEFEKNVKKIVFFGSAQKPNLFSILKSLKCYKYFCVRLQCYRQCSQVLCVYVCLKMGKFDLIKTKRNKKNDSTFWTRCILFPHFFFLSLLFSQFRWIEQKWQHNE